MQCFSEIIPIYEAFLYLSERFSKNRTSDRIKHFEPYSSYMSDKEWTTFLRIGELQRELDELIPTDEIMERYFLPLGIRSEQPYEMALTIGGMLLIIPPSFDSSFTYDDLIEYYRTADQQELLSCFYGRSIYPFYQDNCDVNVTMSGFVSAVNRLLVNNDDKWRLIDCALNPFEHLEKMRPLVMKTVKLIEEKAKGFADFFEIEMNEFCTGGSLCKKLSAILHTEVKEKMLSKAKVFGSLIAFSAFNMFYNTDTFEYTWIFAGVFNNALSKLKQKNENSDIHIQLLKMLSDQTRFNILHELCDRESYGQELADKFGGARSAIYYHLEKLLGYGLIDLNMTEYRMLYKMNKRHVYDKMNAIRDYLLNGWKPEDEPDADAETPETGGESGPEE